MTDIITIRGFVATDPKPSITKNGVQAVSFRIGSPLKRWDRTKDTWGTDHMNWFSVEAYRHLAGNLACSLKKGQKIIVVGKLKNRTWEKDGRTYFAAEIEADSVGHDLSYGSASYTRTSDTQPTHTSGSRPGIDQDSSGPDSMESFGDGDSTEEEGHTDADPFSAEPADGPHATVSILLQDDQGRSMAVDPSTGEVTAAV